MSDVDRIELFTDRTCSEKQLDDQTINRLRFNSINLNTNDFIQTESNFMGLLIIGYEVLPAAEA